MSYGHEIWGCGDVAFAVPRRRQLSDGVARHISVQLESMLGEEWWRPATYPPSSDWWG